METSIIIAIFSLIISTISIAITTFFSIKSANNRKVEVHLQFQKEMRNIQRQFPNSINKPNWKPSEKDYRLIYLYWYLVFDEWLICTQCNPELEVLWNKYYKNGVKSALKKPAFRKVIKKLFDKDSKFLEHHSKFKKEIFPNVVDKRISQNNVSKTPRRIK